MSLDLDPEIAKKLAKSLEDTKIASIKPSKDKLDEILHLQADQISTIQDSKLTEYIYALAQYQVFLHVQSNSRKILFLESKRTFDAEVSRQVVRNTQGKTVKERLALALENDPRLQELEKDMRIKEADQLLFDNVPESVSELSNALKKELSIRFTNKGFKSSSYER